MSRLLDAMAVAAVCGCVAPFAGAEAVYDNISSGTDGVAFFGDIVIDNVVIEGGGLLQGATIALTAEGVGTVTTDLQLLVFVDGGNGFPDIMGPGDDVQLLSVDLMGLKIEAGVVNEIEIDLSDYWTTVEDGSLVYIGVQPPFGPPPPGAGLGPSVGHVFYGDPVVGSTDAIVFSFGAMGPVPVPGASNPELMNSAGLGLRLDVVQLPGAAPGGPGEVGGDAVTFAGEEEGFKGPSYLLGGVTFSDGFSGLGAPAESAQFAIDDGTDAWADNPGMLDFVQGELLSLNCFVGGGGYCFSAFKAMRISDGQVHTGARMSIAYVTESFGDLPVDFTSNEITLLAMMGDEMVAQASVNPDNQLGMSGGGSFEFGASEIGLAGVEFDSLVLFSNGPTFLGFTQLGIDNLVLGDAIGGPCDEDLDDSGVIDSGDLNLVLGSFGCVGGGCDGDVDGDGDTDSVDLNLVLAGFGQVCE